jgi:hypothetical protein
LAQLGYKLRVHINKALKTRCKAIQAALRKYNEAAKELNRPQLDWKDVSTYDTLADFELLQECQVDICQQPWADPRNRQISLHRLKLERAEEERRRLNIEISRLVDWMSQEESQLRSATNRLRSEGSPLAVEASRFLARRIRQNNVHRARIQKIYALSCYTGWRELIIGSLNGADVCLTWQVMV